MPPRLYSSGGETQASAANVQATPVPGVDGLIQSLNTFASEQLQKSVAETKGRITDLASKAQQDMQLKGGDNYLLAETPRFASAEFYNTYERASRKVLLEEMKNDVRDLALQAMNTETTFSDPKAFEAAYKQQYTMMRDKVMVNAEFARDFVPELDEVFRENLTNFKYEVSARQMNWMRQDLEARVDTNYALWAEATRNRFSATATKINNADEYEPVFEANFDGVEKNAGEILSAAWMKSPEKKNAAVLKLKDDLSEDFMTSAITSLMGRGRFSVVKDLVDRNAKGELFRENPSLRPKIGGAGSGLSKGLKYFIDQVTSAVVKGEPIPDIAARFEADKDSPGWEDWFGGAARGLISEDGRTNWKAITDLIDTHAMLDKNFEPNKNDWLATLALGDAINGRMASDPTILSKIAKADKAAGGLEAWVEPYAVEGVTVENIYTLYMGNRLDKNGAYSVQVGVGGEIDSAEERLVVSLQSEKDPVYKQNIVQALRRRAEKFREDVAGAYGKRSLTDVYFETYPGRKPVLTDFALVNVPKGSSADAADEIHVKLGESQRWAGGIPGVSQGTVQSMPWPTDLVKGTVQAIDFSLQNGNVDQALKYIDTMTQYGQRHSGNSYAVLNQIDPERASAYKIAALMLNESDRVKFMSNYATAGGAVKAFSESTLGVINQSIVSYINDNQSGIKQKLWDMAGGEVAEYQRMIQNVLLPVIAQAAVAAGFNDKSDDSSLAAMVTKAMSGEAGQWLVESTGEPTTVKLKTSEGVVRKRMYRPEYRDPGVVEAIEQSFAAPPAGVSQKVLIGAQAVVGYSGSNRVIRWSTRPGGTEFIRDSSGNVYEYVVQ